MKSAVLEAGIAWFKAYAVGTVPTRISMIRPMPFCPSFDPWPKLTPVQVRTSKQRIQNGGGSVPSGASKRRGSLIRDLEMISNSAAQNNPTIGEINKVLPTFAACAQSTPLVPVFTDMS